MGKLVRPVLASVFAALAVAVALCVVHAPVYATPPDDFVQELFARGQFQAAASGGLMPYSLVLVSAPLSALYALAPAVPWYALMLLALIVVSFSVAYYRASALGLARWQLACVMCALITCEVLCVLYFTFTMVAFVSLAAGLMLILPRATFGDAGRLRVSEVLGYLLVAVGFSLRPESGIAALLLFAPFLVWVLARNRRAASLGRALAVALVIAASYGAGQLAYRSAPGWQDYPAYLDAGRTVLDSQQMAVGEVRSRAPELSENDVAVMYDWDFVDHDVFDTDLFARIGSFETKYGVSNLAASLQAKVTYLLFGLAAALAVAALVACVLGRRRRGRGLRGAPPRCRVRRLRRVRGGPAGLLAHERGAPAAPSRPAVRERRRPVRGRQPRQARGLRAHPERLVQRGRRVRICLVGLPRQRDVRGRLGERDPGVGRVARALGP